MDEIMAKICIMIGLWGITTFGVLWHLSKTDETYLELGWSFIKSILISTLFWAGVWTIVLM